MSSALLLLGFLLIPAVALFLVRRFAWAERLGAIVLLYAAGLLVANLGLLPADFTQVQKTISEVCVALALPMILLTVNVRAWARIAGRALASMGLAVLSITLVAVLLFFVFRALGTERAYELSALAVGVYTGGTPNLAAIKTAVGVPEARYLLFNAFDVAVGALYLMLMVTLAKPVFAKLLPAPQPGEHAVATLVAPVLLAEQDENYAVLLNRRSAVRIAASLGVAAAVVGMSAVLAQLAGAGGSVALMITLLSVLALVAAQLPRVRQLNESYKAGMYLIYIFSFTVASMARFDALADMDMSLLLFIAIAVFGSLGVHALLCRMARIDVNTFLVTSVSAVCSPAFVPLMARSLNSQMTLLSGIGTGIIGYAIGTNLGIGLAFLLQRFD